MDILVELLLDPNNCNHNTVITTTLIYVLLNVFMAALSRNFWLLEKKSIRFLSIQLFLILITLLSVITINQLFLLIALNILILLTHGIKYLKGKYKKVSS